MAAPIQKELGLTEKQKSQLKKLDTTMSQKRRQMSTRSRRGDSDPEKMRTSMDSLRREQEEAISNILEPKQKTRLGEIKLQREGIFAVARTDVAKKLKLTSTQTDQIKTIVDQMRKDERAAMPRPSEGSQGPGGGSPGGGPPGENGFQGGGPPGEGGFPGGGPPGDCGQGGGPPGGGSPGEGEAAGIKLITKPREVVCEEAALAVTTVEYDILEYLVRAAGRIVSDIFKPFFRVEDDRSRASGGVGLGLAIARRAVEVHQGKIAANNTRPGLVITISLPHA